MCTVRGKPSLPAPTSLCDGELYLPALSLVLGCFVISPDSPAVSNTGAGRDSRCATHSLDSCRQCQSLSVGDTLPDICDLSLLPALLLLSIIGCIIKADRRSYQMW